MVSTPALTPKIFPEELAVAIELLLTDQLPPETVEVNGIDEVVQTTDPPDSIPAVVAGSMVMLAEVTLVPQLLVTE